MNILDKLVIPAPLQHLELYNYLLIIALSILLVYSAILFGSSVLSIYYYYLGKRNPSVEYSKISLDYIDLITNNKLMGFGLAFIPFLTIMMLYTQLLHMAKPDIIAYVLVAFLLYIGGWIGIYTYKYSFHLNKLLDSVEIAEMEEKHVPGEYRYFSKSAKKLNNQAGIWGIVLMFFGLWILIGSMSLAINQWKWTYSDSIFYVIFSFDTLLKFLHFSAAAIALTGGTFLLYKFNKKSKEEIGQSEYLKFSRKLNLSLALTFTIIQPLFFALEIYMMPQQGLAKVIFFLAIIIFLVSFLAIHFYYAMFREVRNDFALPSFILLIILLAAFIANEQTNFGYSNRNQELVIAAKYQKIEAQLASLEGRAEKKVSGREIYDRICSACHRFDRQVVGPAYNTVLGKYQGNKQKLVQFILNPVKVNPNLPAMPNPGLKPNEASAVADFLLQNFGKTVQ